MQSPGQLGIIYSPWGLGKSNKNVPISRPKRFVPLLKLALSAV
jgi:hypothetical protein